MALPSFAVTRILYQQNFETATDAASTGWSYGGASMTIASDNFGKFLELSQGQTNGRSAQVTWGQDIFMNDGVPVLEDGTYNLKFDFSIKQGSTNQYNSEFTVFTNHAPIANNKYRTPWSQAPEASCWDNYLFDMSQDEPGKQATVFAIDAPTEVTENAEGTKTYSLNYSDLSTLETGKWYTVDLMVNVESREVEYRVFDVNDEENPVKEGTRIVPETDINGDPVSMYAEGLFILVARYQTIYDIDNILISYDSSEDYANAPTVALTRLGKTADDEINDRIRAYTITFLDGETLHVTGTDGVEVEAEYADCEPVGSYTYETTTSGTFKAWTTCGEATSEIIETVVDCDPIKLPEVVATISSVTEGFGKTYTLSVDNSEVPLRPSISIEYEFTGVNGDTFSSTEDVYSGAKVTVDQEGTLKLISKAAGYASASVEVKNDIQFETKKVYDFARLTEDEIKAAGFPKVDPLRSDATSGENNWTARKRLYYEIEGSEHENDKGETVRDFAYPFGYVAENENALIERYLIDNSGKESVDAGAYFPGLNIFPDAGKKSGGFPNVGILYRIGLYNNETNNNNNNVIVKDLDQTDFVVVNAIDNYGGDSNHPVLPAGSDEEYYKVLAGTDEVLSVAASGVLNEETNLYDVTYALYRIQKAITKITIFKQAGSQSGVEGVEAEVEGDNWYYSIDGVRMAEPTRPGIYIHNGKKIIVK